jgi:hypothetical protein
MDDLLIKYILEEATPEESDQVQQWLAADTANRARFEKLQAVWKLAAPPDGQPATDTPQALQRLKQIVKAKETAPVKRIWPRVWTAAAAVVGIAGVALGAYILMKPKDPVKNQPPVMHPDTLLQQPVRVDTMPTMAPVKDTIPFVQPRKKKKPAPVPPVQSVHPKKKGAKEPTQPVDTPRVKKKHPAPVQTVHPVRKHKRAPPAKPQAPVKEPPVT